MCNINIYIYGFRERQYASIFWGTVQHRVNTPVLCFSYRKNVCRFVQKPGETTFFFHTCRIGCHINGISIYLMVAYFLKKKGGFTFSDRSTYFMVVINQRSDDRVASLISFVPW